SAGSSMSSGAAAPAAISSSCSARRATAGSTTGRGPAGPPRPWGLGALSTLPPPHPPAHHRPGPPPTGKPLPLRSSLHLSDGMAGYLRPARRPPAWLLAPLWQRVHLRPLGRRRLTVPEHAGAPRVRAAAKPAAVSSPSP